MAAIFFDELLSCVKKGLSRLPSDSKDAIKEHVMSLMTSADVFVGEGGEPSMYHTLLGWHLCHLLDIRTAQKSREIFLDEMDRLSSGSDEAGIELLELCKRIHWVLRYGRGLGLMMGPQMDPTLIVKGYAERSEASAKSIALLYDGNESRFDKLFLEDELNSLKECQQENGLFGDIVTTFWVVSCLGHYHEKPLYPTREYFLSSLSADDDTEAPEVISKLDLETLFFLLAGLGQS